MSEHTPGTWTVHPLWTNNPCIENGGVFEVEEAHYDVKERLEEGCDVERVIEANARLIAAAPDLLAACEAAMRIETLWCDSSFNPSNCMGNEEGYALHLMREKFRAAIAKATGAAP